MNLSQKHIRYFSISLNLIFLLSLLTFGFLKIQSANNLSLEKDAAENALISYHIATDGRFSLDGQNPTYQREPLDNFLNSIAIRITLNKFPEANAISIQHDSQLIKRILRINLLYLIIFFLSGWWLVYLITKSHFLVIPALFFPSLHYTFTTFYLINLGNDLLASGLFTLSVATFYNYTLNNNKRSAILCGFTLGALALTKAIVFYVFILMIVLFAVVCFLLFRDKKFKFLQNTLVILLCFCIMIAPWMFRNYQHFGDFAISQRGGAVLLIRAIKNQMTNEEIVGAFYLYSPKSVQRVLNKIELGQKADAFEDGGKFQRLNRDLKSDILKINASDFTDLTSYYRIAKHGIPNNLKFNQSIADSTREFEQNLKKIALTEIKENTSKHLMLTPLFGWRGFWAYRGNNLIMSLANLLTFIGLFYVFIHGIFTKNLLKISLTILPILFFGTHAFLTHYIPRYSAPLIPIASIVTVVFLYSEIKARSLKTLNR